MWGLTLNIPLGDSFHSTAAHENEFSLIPDIAP
jgi:hypothetical protein